MKTKIKKTEREIILDGMATSPGIALGEVFIFRSFTINISELEIKVEDIEQEIMLFEDAIQRVIEQLEFARSASETFSEEDFGEIFESQKAFLSDPVLIKEIKQEIKKSRHSAAFVISKVLSMKSEYFINLENTYFRERAYDIMDLKYKLIHAVLGISIDYHLSRPAIVVAEMLSPSDTVQFNRNLILGFLTDKGGKTSHAAIMARSLRIPAVVNGFNLSKVLHDGDYVIIDGFEGRIIINPSAETKRRYRKIKSEYVHFEEELFKDIALPAVTGDGRKVELLANIEFIHELNDVKENQADGVGLFRTESVFIEQKSLPSEETQFQLYKKLAEQVAPHSATIRTVDLGGDKLLEGYSEADELNPFLGWRAIRFCLDKPQVFKTQLKAILRASAFGKIQILLPMISAVEEITLSKKLIAEVQRELTNEGVPFDANIPIGVMVETPSAAISAEIFAHYVDFFSIGTNDLTQYVLAIDRTNDRVSKYYNTFNPSVLHFVAHTIEVGKKHNLPVTLCGEFAASPEAIPLLLGMGLTSFSMNPFYIASAKKVIRACDIKSCQALYRKVKTLHSASEIENTCLQFLKAHVADLKFLI